MATRYTEPGEGSWVGKEMMDPEGKVGTVVVDDNSVQGGALRVLTVEFEDGTKKDLTLANVGPNPSETREWKWYFENQDEWVPWSG